MKIIVDDLTNTEVHKLLEQHLEDMYRTSPPESVHALEIEVLKTSDITFWTCWINNELAACIALKRLDEFHGEIKSLRAVEKFRNQGIAAKMVLHLEQAAITQGYQRLSLETGTQDFFAPARNLYRKLGYHDCEPFGDYQLDPNSAFMTKEF